MLVSVLDILTYMCTHVHAHMNIHIGTHTQMVQSDDPMDSHVPHQEEEADLWEE